MAGNKKILLKNTIMLYILTFSTYLMSFITVPYQTRVLGPEKYGLLGVATAVMAYFQLFIDFGFLLSATEEVAQNREDKRKLSEIFTSVTINKILLATLGAGILFSTFGFVEQWRENWFFFFLNFISIVLGSLLPDYLYRGLEKMSAITIRSVLIRLLFTLMIFVFVKTPEDYLLIPILHILGNGAALAGVYIHLFWRLKIGFIVCKLQDIWRRLKRSLTFFFSRIATTVYTVTNTIVLDLFSGGTLTAYYTAGDKLISTAKNGLSPISDSLYPYMVRNKDFKLIKKVLLIIEPIIVLGCAILFVIAEPFCVWFFGSEYAEAGDVLRSLLPVVIVILPSYIFGFPVLGAMGINKYANYSVVFGSIVHIIILISLYLCNLLSLVSLGIATSITESLILLFRLIAVWKNKHLLKHDDVEKEGEK